MDQIFKHLTILGLICITRVVADDCAPYIDSDFAIHQGQTCILSFCAGSCTNRYCNIIPGTQLDQSQFLCILNNLYFVIGAGIILFLLIVASIISCICKSLCLCCRLCEQQPQTVRRSLTTSMSVTNIVPQQPLVTMPALPDINLCQVILCILSSLTRLIFPHHIQVQITSLMWIHH
ncbi:unnamed protein product, partial [Staurois parvus]